MYIYMVYDIWYMIMIYDMTVTSCEDLSGVYPKFSHCFPVSPSASSTAGELDPVADRTVLPFIGVIFALVFLIIYMVKASGGQPHPKPMHGYHLCWALKEGACILASVEVVPNFWGTRFLEDSSCKPIHWNSRSCCFQPYKTPPTILIPVHVCFWYGILHASNRSFVQCLYPLCCHGDSLANHSDAIMVSWPTEIPKPPSRGDGTTSCAERMGNFWFSEP